MPNSTSISANLSGNPFAQSKLRTDLMLSLGTVPLLLILVGSRAMASLMKDMGQTSEELFRGERLPILKISSIGLDRPFGEDRGSMP